VVDASGPFQAYAGDIYKLVRASIALGADYMDLADSSEFVAGIVGFDAAARAKGVYVLCGVSSFPVLTAAAVRRLAGGVARLEAIRAGVAPSPFARVGTMSSGPSPAMPATPRRSRERAGLDKATL
jgi:saccharopine dehydrogenase-like NADP-dependent oxidoreductase